jgi:hypothetical protein
MHKDDDPSIPLVLYSGGMDSTLMLYTELLKGSADTLYVENNGTSGRSFMERRAREKAMDWFLSDHGKDLKGRVLQDKVINLNETLVQVKGYKMVQPLAWLIAGLMAFDKNRHSELQIGYILGDAAPVKSAELEAFWRNAYALMHWCMPQNAPPVRFPLLEKGFDKGTVLSHLPLELADKIWVCELPQKKDDGSYHYCKVCTSCRTHLHALYDYKHQHQWDYGAWVLHNRRIKTEGPSLENIEYKERNDEPCIVAVGS